jgi:hypothetical protein
MCAILFPARVPLLACPAVPVCGELISHIQPFGGQAMNGRQVGVLLWRIELIVSAMVTGKRQFMDVARIVVMPHLFSMSRSPFHAHNHFHNGHCWTSQQWHPCAGYARRNSRLRKSQYRTSQSNTTSLPQVTSSKDSSGNSGGKTCGQKPRVTKQNNG